MDPLIQPVIEARDYRLRPFNAGDAPLIQDASSDPLIPLITTVPRNGTRKEISEFIARQHHRLAERSGCSFAIADADSDQALGQIGLWLRNSNHGRASIGYWVGPSHRNRGIASAALDAISQWGLELPDIHRLELYVEPWNEGSWKTAEHCGYMREGLLRSWEEIGGARKDMYMYSRLG